MAVLNVAKNMIKRMTQEDQEVLQRSSPPTSAAMTDEVPMTYREMCWKRFAKLLQVVALHSMTGAILLGVENIRERLAQEALDAYNRLS